MRRLTGAIALIAGMVVAAVPAAADPGTPPTEPVPAPAPPPGPAEFIPQQVGIGNVLGQSGNQPAGLLGMPDLSTLGPNLLLGQNPTPAPPGSPAAPPGSPAVPVAPVVPSLSAMNPQYLLGQNVDPAAPGQGVTAPGLGPNQDIPGTGRISFLHRIYEMYESGGLKGALLGQQSPEEFTQQATEAATEATTGPEATPATVLPTESAVPPPPG